MGFGYYLKAVLITTSIFSCIQLPTEAANFARSEASLKIEFDTLPRNPNADSNREAISPSAMRDAIAFTGNNDSVADSNADGTLEFITEPDRAVLSLDFASNASGDGTNYFSVGQNNAFASNTFSVNSDRLSFDFAISLALENNIDRELNSSINTFSEVSFALFDRSNNLFIGEFLTVGNLDTNLADGINNDLIFAESNLNFTIDSYNKEELFKGNREFAKIDITGSIQQIVVPTQVSLQANLYNISCVQAPQTSDPCLKVVPESNNAIGSILSLLGISLFYKRNNS